MILVLLAYFGGVVTIVSPCILPVLPFVFARADRPFVSSGLPLLAGMAATFAVVATLAAVGGGWVVEANQYGRIAAIALLAVFGVTLLFPALSDRMTRPLVALGARLSQSADRASGSGGSTMLPSLLLGVATGLLWAPCAGPVLGLILTSRRPAWREPANVAAARGVCGRRRDIPGIGAAGRRTRIHRNEALTGRRRVGTARPGCRGPCRRGCNRFRPRHRLPHTRFARQHGIARTGPA
ncbi:MAG TPA: cytochrome c biogenesis protein CcdA, partial [Acetobacteraceae bacterium]|nr:cytochrome c biogenesis protein CcdA [Acetobacteraceae bacterium]